MATTIIKTVIQLRRDTAENWLANKDVIPKIPEWWWLRSPGDSQDIAASVNSDGSLSRNYVDHPYGVVRPALYILDSDLCRGDKFWLAGHLWTVLSNNIALCDDSVGASCFRKDWRAKDANDYEKSDIRKRLYEWAEENGIELASLEQESTP